LFFAAIKRACHSESGDSSRVRLGNDKIGLSHERPERRQSTKFLDLAILNITYKKLLKFIGNYVYTYTIGQWIFVLCKGESNFLQAVEAIDTDTNISTARNTLTIKRTPIEMAP
jgi:hypothetical protein